MATVFPETRHSLPELCKLPEDVGPCYGKELRWRYDSELLHCGSMLYTGCGGNANLFTSVESCERACGEYRHQRVCQMPSQRGSCHQSTAKWYYNGTMGECHLFHWSGCGGNGGWF